MTWATTGRPAATSARMRCSTSAPVAAGAVYRRAAIRTATVLAAHLLSTGSTEAFFRILLAFLDTGQAVPVAGSETPNRADRRPLVSFPPHKPSHFGPRQGR